MLVSRQITPPQDYEHRMKIVAATDSLMEDHCFDEITVTKICEEAQISRSTFYRYFTDKYLIIQWYSDLIASTGIFEIGRTLSWYEGLLYTIQGHHDFQRLFVQASRATGYNSLSRHAERARRHNLIETVTKYKHAELSDELNMQIVSLSISETMIMMRWMKKGMAKSPAEMARLITTTIPCDLYELLK